MSITASKLGMTFGSHIAIRDFDLHVPTGTLVVLLGPSGCGKTTTMRCIAGLEVPTSGTISIGDRVVFDRDRHINVPIHQRRLGMGFQSYALWPHMTVFENVAFPLRMANLPRDEIVPRVERFLALVGLAAVAQRGASELSGGQMQRVALARSLVTEPAVLLLDEPLSNLDARLRDRLRIEIRDLQLQLGITSIYVTHDQHEALAIADEIVVMNAGSILQRDSPVDLYQRPTSSTVADFLGYSNIFDATVIEHRDDRVCARLSHSAGNIVSLDRMHTIGSDVSACVRPTDVRISPLQPNGALGDNAFIGDVISASFEGSHITFRVRVNEHVIWECMQTAASLDMRVGNRVRVDVAPQHMLLLPKS